MNTGIINYLPYKMCHILWPMFTNEVNYLGMSIPNDSHKPNFDTRISVTTADMFQTVSFIKTSIISYFKISSPVI